MNLRVPQPYATPTFVGAMLLGGCYAPNVVDGETSDVETSSSTSTTEPESSSEDVSSTSDEEHSSELESSGSPLPMTPNEPMTLDIANRVDILFVLDNSASMAQSQRSLMNGLPALIDPLRASRIHYRIGVTTTDGGMFDCSENSENGQLVLSSCRARLEKFEPPALGIAEPAPTVCTDACALETLDILPTGSAADSDAKPRPWLESYGGQTNITGGVSALEALRCILPQGINGCGFEAPLESFWQTAARSEDPNDNQFGFVRDDALLAIIFVTDEADCSYASAQTHLGTLDDEAQFFWPEDDLPTSAICWKAGVRCDGDSDGVYEHCEAVDLDLRGTPLGPELALTEAVLHPLARYVDRIKALQERTEVVLFGINGVPQGYPDVALQYRSEAGNALSPNFVEEFGVGPGCVSEDSEAVPPMRIKEFLDTFTDDGANGGMFSICEATQDGALAQIAEDLSARLHPLCMRQCVAPDPLCTVEQQLVLRDGSVATREVPPCSDELDPNEVTACYVQRTVPEEMSEQCRDQGWNLEFEIIEYVSPELLESTRDWSFSAVCEPSTDVARDCPNLPR